MNDNYMISYGLSAISYTDNVVIKLEVLQVSNPTRLDINRLLLR